MTGGSVVYDTGALVAADRGKRPFFALHDAYLADARQLFVPSPVLTQAWRNGSRQVRLARALRGCTIQPTSESIARQAGELLGRAGLSEAVDAIVMITALRLNAHVVTSDPDDLGMLMDALRPVVPIPLLPV